MTGGQRKKESESFWWHWPFGKKESDAKEGTRRLVDKEESGDVGWSGRRTKWKQ